jgi:hypothetical protein
MMSFSPEENPGLAVEGDLFPGESYRVSINF